MRTVERSLALHERAIEVIPGGAQTLSKMYGRFVPGVSPAFIAGGHRSKVWDADGNHYIDWTAALGPVGIGYGLKYMIDDCQFRRLGELVNWQYGSLISSPLPTHYEVELAEKLVDIIPCAEMVRFMKNGSDATTAAVRLARYMTNKDRVICCGYHGWHDWYAYILPFPKCGGIPRHGSVDVVKIDYGDLVTLKDLFEERNIACFILEPMSRQCPELANKRVLKRIRELCDEYGVILIFDEMIMGVRYAMAGGQELYGITPDLACYGKAIANGFPLAALVGKKDLMKETTKLQVSGTYFGEVLSIAVALDVIEFMENNKVIESLWGTGKVLNPGIKEMINRHGLGNNGEGVVSLKGFGPWSSFVWNDDYFDEQCYFLQEIVKRGILYSRDHFVMWAHTEEDVQRTLRVYDEVFEEIKNFIDRGIRVKDKLEGTIDENLFPA